MGVIQLTYGGMEGEGVGLLGLTVNLLICDRVGALYSVRTSHCLLYKCPYRNPLPPKKFNCKYCRT
jgi:hypothetical protein